MVNQNVQTIRTRRCTFLQVRLPLLCTSPCTIVELYADHNVQPHNLCHLRIDLLGRTQILLLAGRKAQILSECIYYGHELQEGHQLLLSSHSAAAVISWQLHIEGI